VPHSASATLPVEDIVGGERHGLSFLERLRQVEGIPLERPALIEGRYAYSPRHNGLVLSPGFEPEKPSNYEDALGRVLSPSFEVKCLTCHGQPITLATGNKGGIHCESCHGPALDHVNSLKVGDPGRAMVRPPKISDSESIKVCAQCHSGLTDHSDPLPEDLLVSDQVPALRNSECFIQSGEGLSCIDCHNPHDDSKSAVETSTRTCLKCHSQSREQHAAICPINTTGNCVACHMPSVQSNSFRLTDHWIRTHPEQGIKATKLDERLRSQVPAKREFLRIIVVADHQQAELAKQRLEKGDAFAHVARQISIDATAAGGGYIGEMELSQMDAKLAAAASKLAYGETSGIVDLGDHCVLLHRMPRDFKWDANRLLQEASALKTHGDLKSAIDKDRQALEIYPYFLRALIFMGSTLGEAGEAERASEILRFAAEFYPKDASSQFDLGLTLGKRPAEQIQAFQRAIDLNPDMTAAYESLGAALYSAGQAQSAISVFHKGLQIDPLSAKLNFDLGLALKQQGDEAGAKRALDLAAKLDPEIAVRSPK
ncbi:MAG: peptidylprolyl isomerase, partial [Acidobacteriota bacterium]|nr:peptidylprolyl isomerase [Acidobacteriota bacterium]